MEKSNVEWSPSPDLLAELSRRAQPLGMDIETYIWMLLNNKAPNPQTVEVTADGRRYITCPSGFVMEIKPVSARDAEEADAYFAPGGPGHIEDYDKAIEDGRDAAMRAREYE